MAGLVKEFRRRVTSRGCTLYNDEESVKARADEMLKMLFSSCWYIDELERYLKDFTHRVQRNPNPLSYISPSTGLFGRVYEGFINLRYVSVIICGERQQRTNERAHARRWQALAALCATHAPSLGRQRRRKLIAKSADKKRASSRRISGEWVGGRGEDRRRRGRRHPSGPTS